MAVSTGALINQHPIIDRRFYVNLCVLWSYVVSLRKAVDRELTKAAFYHIGIGHIGSHRVLWETDHW